jgi:ribonuclease D
MHGASSRATCRLAVPIPSEEDLFDDTPLFMVDTPEALRDVAERLSRARAVGVDTESDSFHHYQEKVCLIQFSDLEADYVVDPIALRGDLSPLAPMFANPEVVKIFHGADYDVVCLKRDFRFEIRNLFDTMVSAQHLSLPRVGLADLIGEFFGIDIEKKYQRHDWSERPLGHEHIEYARGDTHWLLALREILTRRLERGNKLHRLVEECRRLERREWEGRTFDPEGYLRIKTGTPLDDPGKRILRRLYLYRDEQARRLDRPAFKVLPDAMLVDVARAKPSSETELERLFPRSNSAVRRRHGTAFLTSVSGGLDDDFEIPVQRQNRGERTPGRLPGRLLESAMNALKDWRNAVVAETPNGNPVAVISNGILKEIARSRPFNVEELAQVPDIREWQVTAYGEKVLAILDQVAPRDAVEKRDEESASGSPGARKRRRRRGGRR